MKTSTIRKIFIIVSITAICTGITFLFMPFNDIRICGLWTTLGGVAIGIIGMFINTDIKAVKASYFANNGSTFHMSREDPDEYSLYDCTMPIIFVGPSLVLLFLSQVAFSEHSQSLESIEFIGYIKKQKEKSLNPRKFLDVQDRTRTGCLRSL